MIEPAKIQIRFADLDILGHVNNNVYLSYFEMARVHYFRYLLGKDYDWKKNGVVLVKNSIEYLKPLYLNDDVRITMYVEEIGNKSFTLGYELTVNDEVRTLGSSTLVAFDSITHQSKEINEDMMRALKMLTSE